MRRAAIVLLVLAACSDGETTLDATTADLGVLRDAGNDAAGPEDATGDEDATAGDDARATDAIPDPDAEEPDAELADAEEPDAELADAGDLDAGDLDAGDLDAGDLDAGDLDADLADTGSPCVPETDEELCVAHAADCDPLSATDRCNTPRTIASCGTCIAPQSCGARAANLCGLEHWYFATIDANGDVGREVSLALDALGYPAVAYQKTFASDSDLMFSVFDGNVWNTTTVDPGTGAGLHTSIALDPNNTLHIAATSAAGLALWTRTSSGTWTPDPITASTRGRVDLAFDPAGVPHLCIFDEVSGDLVHWSKPAASWIADVLEGDPAPAARQGDYCSIAADAFGSLWISYYDEQLGRSKVAFNLGSGWTTEEVDHPAGESAGKYSSIAIDSSGIPGISYRAGDNTFREIRVARYAMPWFASTVDPLVGAADNYTNLQFDHSDFDVVTYYDSSGAGTIEIAHDYFGMYEYESLETVGSMNAGWNAFVLDASDSPQVAYYNAITRSLRFARYVP